MKKLFIILAVIAAAMSITNLVTMPEANSEGYVNEALIFGGTSVVCAVIAILCKRKTVKPDGL